MVGKIRRLVVLFMVATMLMMFFGVFNSLATVNPTSDDPIIIKFNTSHHPGSVRVNSMEYFKYLVELKTEGRVRVDIYPSSQLGGHREVLEMIRLGTVEMDVGDLAANYAAEMGVTMLPYLFRDRAHAFSVLDGPIGEEIVERLPEFGIRAFPNAHWENGFRQITNSRRPVHAPEDLVGLKNRVVEAPVYMETMSAFGVLTTPLSIGEVYSALQTRIIDGQDNPLSVITINKIHEVQDHIAFTNHIYGVVTVWASEIWWQTLPEDIQDAIVWALGQTTPVNRYLSIQDDDLLDVLKEENPNIQVTYPDPEPFRKLVYEKVYPKFYDTIGEDLINRVINWD